jgi:hypothetical protein
MTHPDMQSIIDHEIELATKWEGSPFLDGLEGDVKHKCAVLLENTARYFLDLQEAGDERGKLVERFLPLVAKICAPLCALPNFHVMSLPASLIYDQETDSCFVVVAKTMLMGTSISIEALEATDAADVMIAEYYRDELLRLYNEGKHWALYVPIIIDPTSDSDFLRFRSRGAIIL